MSDMEILHLLVIFLLCIQNYSYADSDEWNGAWFPNPPIIKNVNITEQIVEENKPHHAMGVPTDTCDNGIDNLQTDFDPKNSSLKIIFTCLEDPYTPDFNTTPFLTIYQPPPNYVPNHQCMSEFLIYSVPIPTMGAHRPLWPKYGEYEYCPVQRWLHSIEHGAIVLLFHPCANRNELNKFKSLLKSCLFRHIITPYNLLTKERPFALAAWGVSLELSVYEETISKHFIKNHAKTGPEFGVWQDGQYSMLLIEPSKYLDGSDMKDSVICP